MPEAVIAVVSPLTGPTGALGTEMAQAAELAVDTHAASAAADVHLERYDDEGDRRTGRNIARTLAGRPGVLGVIGHYNSDITLLAASTYNAAGLPLVSPIVSNPALTDQGMPAVFRFTNRDDQTALAIASHLRHARSKSRAVVVETLTTYGSSMATQFTRQFSKLGGEVILYLSVEEGDTAAEDLIATLAVDYDVLFYGGTFEGAGLVRAMRAAGHGQLFAAGDGCWDGLNFLQPAGSAAEAGEGCLVLSATPELGVVPGSLKVAARYERRFGPINNYALNTYDATMMLLTAIATARTGHSRISRTEVTAALRAAPHHGVAYQEPSSWNPAGDNRAAVTALHVVRHGRFAQVDCVAATGTST
jgi:branched-chain amino acid transport system substrate-binding protein